jgi:hypothetical protein
MARVGKDDISLLAMSVLVLAVLDHRRRPEKCQSCRLVVCLWQPASQLGRHSRHSRQSAITHHGPKRENNTTFPRYDRASPHIYTNIHLGDMYQGSKDLRMLGTVFLPITFIPSLCKRHHSTPCTQLLLCNLSYQLARRDRDRECKMRRLQTLHTMILCRQSLSCAIFWSGISKILTGGSLYCTNVAFARTRIPLKGVPKLISYYYPSPASALDSSVLQA